MQNAQIQRAFIQSDFAQRVQEFAPEQIKWPVFKGNSDLPKLTARKMCLRDVTSSLGLPKKGSYEVSIL